MLASLSSRFPLRRLRCRNIPAHLRPQRSTSATTLSCAKLGLIPRSKFVQVISRRPRSQRNISALTSSAPPPTGRHGHVFVAFVFDYAQTHAHCRLDGTSSHVVRPREREKPCKRSRLMKMCCPLDTVHGPVSAELRGNVGPLRVSQTGWAWAAKLEIRPSERKENEITKLRHAPSRGQAGEPLTLPFPR